jgi:surface protein
LSTFLLVADAHAFNGDISGWNVSHVTSLLNTFGGAYSFNGDISNWDVSNVETLSWTFHDAKSFDGDLSNWNTSSATEMVFLFYGATAFTGKGVDKFDMSNVEDIHGFAYQATMFDANLTLWDTSNIVDMSEAFYGASSFQGIGVSTWDVSNVLLMHDMFGQCNSFNADLSAWNVGRVTSMSQMVSITWHPFHRTGNNNSLINFISVSYVSQFASCGMFQSNLTGWDVSSVQLMDSMVCLKYHSKQNILFFRSPCTSYIAAIFFITSCHRYDQIRNSSLNVQNSKAIYLAGMLVPSLI